MTRKEMASDLAEHIVAAIFGSPRESAEGARREAMDSSHQAWTREVLEVMEEAAPAALGLAARVVVLEELIRAYRDSTNPLDDTEENLYQGVESSPSPAVEAVLRVVLAAIRSRKALDAMVGGHEVTADQSAERSSAQIDELNAVDHLLASFPALAAGLEERP